jgi:hypothetical protein
VRLMVSDGTTRRTRAAVERFYPVPAETSRRESRIKLTIYTR